MEIYHYYTMEVSKVQEETILQHNSTFSISTGGVERLTIKSQP